MIGLYKKLNYITSIGPETHSQSEMFTRVIIMYTSAACDACDKYDLWLGNLTKIYQGN